MKNKLLLFTLLFTAYSLSFGQVPSKISYQGILTNSTLIPIADGNYDVEFKIYNSPNDPLELWSETQTLNVQNGVFSTSSGEVNPINMDFRENYWLGITVGTEAEMTPRIQMVTVPYSFYSQLSDGLTDDATGAVLSLNQLQGNVEIEGDNGITVSKSNNKIIISNTVVAIENIISSKAHLTIDIDGEEVDINIAPKSITDEEIADVNWNTVTNKPTSLPPNGNAGGDLTGQYPNPTIADKGAVTGQLLKWNGTEWVASDDNTGQPSIVSNAPITGDGTIGDPLEISLADGSTDGYLSSADWKTFNDKLDSVVAEAPISGKGTVSEPLKMDSATGSNSGYLTANDWTRFNSNKTVSANAPITGDGTQVIH